MGFGVSDLRLDHLTKYELAHLVPLFLKLIFALCPDRWH